MAPKIIIIFFWGGEVTSANIMPNVMPTPEADVMAPDVMPMPEADVMAPDATPTPKPDTAAPNNMARAARCTYAGDA